MNEHIASRRDFLRASVAALPIASGAYAAGSDVIKVGVIGCGSRGPDAARNALTADKGARLVAMGDLLRDRAFEKRTALKLKFPDQVIADDDHCFGGLDAYQQRRAKDAPPPANWRAGRDCWWAAAAARPSMQRESLRPHCPKAPAWR